MTGLLNYVAGGPRPAGPRRDARGTLLALVPPHKVMHGSDSGSVPEDPAYCAHSLRVVLARVLNEDRTGYGWSERDCAATAHAVMSENARRLFKI